MIIYEYLVKAVQDDARRAGERDRLLRDARRARRARRPFRMAKSDLQARPVYHLRDSIEAHLTVVFAALAVSRWIEARTGWSTRKFVRTARRCKTIQSRAGAHVITAADPPPAGLHEAPAESTATQMRTN